MKEIIMLFTLTILLISVILSFSGRSVVKNIKNVKDENKLVLKIKVISYLFIIISLVTIYYFK